MKTKILITSVYLLIAVAGWGQDITIQKKLETFVFETDTKAKNELVTNRAFNLFLQKKTSYYLTGASEISLSKLYATYSPDNDKFNFGVNFKYMDKDSKLKYLFTPIFESNIKNSFTTLYKSGEWQSDIRLGAKFSWFINGTISFFNLVGKKDQKLPMIKIRNSELSKILMKIDNDNSNKMSKNQKENELILKSLNALKNNKILVDTSLFNKIQNDNLEKDNSSELDSYKTQISNAEVDGLYKNKSYNWFKNYWVSFWFFIPLTEKNTFIAIDNTQSFTKQKLNLWEGNLQANGIIEYNNKISLYGALGLKIFQNNTAIANQMQSVDYYQYSQFPATSTTINNLALVENNKAYIGKYVDFISKNINALLVLSFSNLNKSENEKFCTPGLSFYFEKNFGDYSAMNLRFGLPLRFKGKSTAINIEPQIRLNNINNYSNKTNYKTQPIIGISVGLPFSALFK